MDLEATNQPPVLIDDDSNAFLRIRGYRQGQDLLERAILSNDIDGVRFYLDAMADRWPGEAASTLGDHVYREDLTGEKPFFDQVQREVSAHPEIQKAVFTEARALSRALANADYDRALLLMDRGFELNPKLLGMVLQSSKATDDTLAWMQAAAPAGFERAMGELSMKDLFSAYVAEDKLAYVLTQAPRALKERVAESVEVQNVLCSRAGIRMARVLSETGFEFNGAVLRKSPEKFSTTALCYSDSPKDAEYFARELAPVLTDMGLKLSPSTISSCETAGMLRAVLPLLEPMGPTTVGGTQVKDLPDLLVDASHKDEAREMLALLKEAYAIDYANVPPVVSGSRTEAGPTWRMATGTLALLDVFGPDKLHEKFTLDDWLAVQPAPMVRDLTRELAAHGIDADPGRADLHRALAVKGEGYHKTLPATSWLGQTLADHPERMGEKNAQDLTLADQAMFAGVTLSHENLSREQVQAQLSTAINGVPIAHAYALASPGSRFSEWQKAAEEHGFDLNARDDKGRSVAQVATEQGNLSWVHHARWSASVHQMVHAVDAEENNLLHVLARLPAASTTSASYLRDSAFKRLVDLGVPLHAPNAQGKTALELYRERPPEDKMITADIERAIRDDTAKRQAGVLEFKLTGLSESGQRAHVKFSLVQLDADGKRTETDVTSKVGSVMVSERLSFEAPYEAKAKAVQLRSQQAVRQAGEDPQVFRQRAAQHMAAEALQVVNLLNQSRSLRSIRDYAKERQQKEAERDNAKKAKQAGKGLSV